MAIGESVVVVNGFCGLAETESAEKIRVIETAKTVDFIMDNGRRRDYTRLFLEGVRTTSFTLAKPRNILSL